MNEPLDVLPGKAFVPSLEIVPPAGLMPSTFKEMMLPEALIVEPELLSRAAIELLLK